MKCRTSSNSGRIGSDIAIFTRGKFYYVCVGGGEVGGGGGEGYAIFRGDILLPENCLVIFPWGNSSSGKS